MMNHRPIFLLQYGLQSVTKIFDNRSKAVLPAFVSLNQFALLEGSKIIDNMLLVHEVIKQYHRKKSLGVLQ